MKTRLRQPGLSLMEEVVVVAAIALLVAFGIPAVRALFKSLTAEGGAKPMISGALSTARAIAVKHQRYAGIRFQCAYEPNNTASALTAPQYMIFIIYDFDKTGLVSGFRAVNGFEPIKLPDSVGVMDLELGSPNPDQVINVDTNIDDDWEVNDTTSFSIIFSPSGRLVIHDVRIRNRDGRTQGTETSTVSSDDVFNTLTKITNPIAPHGMFVQDDYPADGFDEEPSRKCFVIYERDKFKETYERGLAWSEYLKYLKPVYINPYTGTMIEK
jgi:hypothetical protein